MEAGDTPINWTSVGNEMAGDFFVSKTYITELRKGFMEDGGIWIYGGSKRGRAVDGADLSKSRKITTDMMKAIATMEDTTHSTGKVLV